MASTPNVALPGQLLSQPNQFNITPGQATHIHASQLYASIPGTVTTSKTTTSITRLSSPLLPQIGTIVLGTITRTTLQRATLLIYSLGPSFTPPLSSPLPAIIRQQDIRATEIDKVKMSESFRVGDVVRAVVISLGDVGGYYCSTARNELGVVVANGGEGGLGEVLVPVSWKEVEGVETGRREGRKVAKPV